MFAIWMEFMGLMLFSLFGNSVTPEFAPAGNGEAEWFNLSYRYVLLRPRIDAWNACAHGKLVAIMRAGLVLAVLIYVSLSHSLRCQVQQERMAALFSKVPVTNECSDCDMQITANVSGGHLNPAVTFATMITVGHELRTPDACSGRSMSCRNMSNSSAQCQ